MADEGDPFFRPRAGKRGVSKNAGAAITIGIEKVLDGPRYGAGWQLQWRRENLARIAFPFDQAII